MKPKMKNILYASDLSENSIPALEWAMLMSHQHDAKITFMHVIEDVSPHASAAIKSFLGEEQWQRMSQEGKRDANAKIEARISRFCENVSSEMDSCPAVPWDTVIARGVPVECILQEAALRKCDFIVMGTHGAGVFKNAMIGSTARRVVRRSKIPVLVIPLEDKENEPHEILDPVI